MKRLFKTLSLALLLTIGTIGIQQTVSTVSTSQYRYSISFIQTISAQRPGIVNGYKQINSPSDISGLTVWLRADVGVDAGSNNFWANQGSEGGFMTSDAAGNRPTVITGGLNGQTALSFDGTDDQLRSTIMGFSASFTMIIVGNGEINKGQDGFGAGWGFVWPAYDDATFRGAFVFTQGVTGMVLTSTGWANATTVEAVRVFTYSNVSSASVGKLYTNGSLTGTTNFSSSNIRTSTRGLMIGRHVNDGVYRPDEWYEIACWDRVLTDSELAAVYANYYKTKFGL